MKNMAKAIKDHGHNLTNTPCILMERCARHHVKGLFILFAIMQVMIASLSQSLRQQAIGLWKVKER